KCTPLAVLVASMAPPVAPQVTVTAPVSPAGMRPTARKYNACLGGRTTDLGDTTRRETVGAGPVVPAARSHATAAPATSAAVAATAARSLINANRLDSLCRYGITHVLLSW